MATFDPTYLHPSYVAAGIDYRDLFNPLGNDVYSTHIFSDPFCEHLLERVTAFEDDAQTDRLEPANSMHGNAVLSEQLGIASLVNLFVEFFSQEIAPQILPERLNLPIDTVHSYVVRYGQVWDQDLGFHVDDSFLTLNIGLNDAFTGSELVLQGERCPNHIDTPSSKGEQLCIQHKTGSMIVHPGKNRHYVQPISSGQRYNLIIWCQSETERRHWFDALKSGVCMDACGVVF